VKELFVFIGPPGAGKGSLSNLCTQKFNWVQLSTGNLCRKHIQEQTEIGKEIAFAIKSGKLISDSLITRMVEEWLTEKLSNDRCSGIILDGFPRAVAQAEAFDRILKERFTGIKLHVIKFSISDENIVNRLTGRLICQNKECQLVYSVVKGSLLQPKQEMTCDSCASTLGQRDDDAITAIKERLIVYHKHTNELLNFYARAKQPLIELCAENTLPEVFEEFTKLIGCKVI
jgi:adenylate kinase